MSDIRERETATIYQFPVSERAARRDRQRLEAAAALPQVDFGSGWYHEAAMQENAEPRKRR